MKRTKILVTIGVVIVALLVGLTSCGQEPVLTLSRSSVEINAGASTDITATATDKTGASDTISVESSDEATATATADGSTISITGVSGGTATITVTSGAEATATCDVTVNDIEVEGTWLIDGAYGDEKWIISNSEIEYQSDWTGGGFNTVFKAEIVEFDNGSFNAGDTTIASGRTTDDENPGFAVIKYTQVDGAGTGEVGKYNIFRWCDNTTTTANKDFTQGYKNVGGAYPNNVNGVFDSAAASKSGATNAAGYFGGASIGAVKQ